MPMYATRGELDLGLEDLRALLPELIAAFKPGEGFWTAFNAEAGIIVRDASPDDAAYVRQQIDEMLSEHGVPPSQEPSLAGLP